MHPIEEALKRLPPSLYNMAKLYPNGRNVFIKCLARESSRTQEEVIEWIKKTKLEIKDLDGYVIKDDTY